MLKGKRSRWIIAAGMVVLLGIVFVARMMRLPAPQGPFTMGAKAPEFTLKNQDGNPVALASLRGQNVLLVYYRGYW